MREWEAEEVLEAIKYLRAANNRILVYEFNENTVTSVITNEVNVNIGELQTVIEKKSKTSKPHVDSNAFH